MEMKVMKYNKEGQVWVETVIYTLIAFVMIAAVLAIAQPRIEKEQDKALIEQSLGVMKDIDNVLLSLAQGGVGNKRLLELGIKEGSLSIDGENDQLVFEMDSTYEYSEPGQDYIEGNTIINTKKRGDEFTVNMTRAYSNYNITYKGKDVVGLINKASTPYQVFISHKGKDTENKIIIDFEIN